LILGQINSAKIKNHPRSIKNKKINENEIKKPTQPKNQIKEKKKKIEFKEIIIRKIKLTIVNIIIIII